ncbi:hypothetical protein ACQKGD_15215 [Peribacillus frigoritolerans]|uniref:hypothetical protein n=1 Tax=Peribacillus frigoritolerans TaxID=450367 RepID=UPI003D06D1D8
MATDKVRVDFKNIEWVKNLDSILTQVMTDERIPLEIREEYIEKAGKVLGLL